MQQNPNHINNDWQLQDAKEHLSELIKLAVNNGPQCIVVDGYRKVIIIAIHEYQKLIGDKTNFFDFMQNSPLMGCELDIDS